MDTIWENIEPWITANQSTLLSILLIIIGAWIIHHFGSIAVRKAVVKSIKTSSYTSKAEEEKREQTVIQLISGILKIVIWPLAAIVIIGQLGVEIAPLIAGIGIVGLAIGFGAQSLVKDIISGLFIIVENQYGVGDVVELNGTAGLVETITLRKTVLRDLDGVVHHIPNGTIDRTSNYSSEYSGINLNVGVSYSSDLDKVIKTVNAVGEQLAEDPEWAEQIIEKPIFLRVDNFGDSAIDIKITGTVKPLMQWDVTGELRKRLKIAFDKDGIEIPFPQRVMHQASSAKSKS